MADELSQPGFAAAGLRSRRGRVLALAAGSVLAVLAVIVGPAHAEGAASGQVAVKLLPAELTLSPGDAATVELVVSNQTADQVRITDLGVRLPAQVTAAHVPSPADIRPIPSSGFALMTFVLRALPGVEDGEVDILLTVRGLPHASDMPSQLVTASLALKAGAAIQVPDAAFASFPDSLNDGQSARAAVRVSNPTPFTLRQIRVTAVNSPDVTLSQAANVDPPFVPCHPAGGQGSNLVGCLPKLASGATAVLYLEATASHRVQTGSQRVSVVVASRIEAPAAPIASAVMATASVRVTIFGLDALSPFGLGTLFVLPGLLTVLTFLLLARYVYPRSKELPDTVQFTDPRTLLFVVPPAALIYLLVWAAWGVNLADQAGTADVALLFALGVGLGFLGWVATVSAYYARSGRKQFRTDDSPDRVLQRLEARHAQLVLPKVAVGSLSYRYLADWPTGKLVVCSPAKYAFAANADEPARLRFRNALTTSDIATIRTEVRRKNVRLRWLLPTGVTLLEPAAGQFQEPAGLITEEDLQD